METSPATSETRQFKMHPRLLMDVIRRQAGTLGKAILEGVQNSADARATKVEVTIDRDRVVIADDGKGFPSRVEIEKFFEVFGQPHDASEGKIYGAFRMGRGQQFAFGRNNWRSGEFAMTVDVEKMGLDYRLEAGLPQADGCRIEIRLYEPLDAMAVFELSRELSRLVKYAEIPVLVNGEKVNKPASLQKWSHTTDEAWFNINPGGEGGVAVYNLGVLVANLTSWDHGCSGTIVSRQQLKVNFARNDIMGTCPVWRKVLPVLRELSGREKVSNTRMTSSQRAMLWKQIIAKGGDLKEWQEHKLFVDSNGDSYSIRQLYRSLHKFRQLHNEPVKVCFAERGSALADRVMQNRLGLVLDVAMLELTGCTKPELFFKQLHFAPYHNSGDVMERDFMLHDLATLAKPLSSHGKEAIAESDLTDWEKIGLKIANSIGRGVARAIAEGELGQMEEDSYSGHSRKVWERAQQLFRNVNVGSSDHADGWTDGKTYVYVERRFVTEFGKKECTFVDMTLLLMHEWCHRKGDIGDHTHDAEFYQAYHELTLRAGEIAAAAKAEFESDVLRQGKRRIAAAKRAARTQVIRESGEAISRAA